MTLTPTQVADCLARIEKLPEEWRHPSVQETYSMPTPPPMYGVDGRPIPAYIALDLHIWHMAKRLAERGLVPTLHPRFDGDTSWRTVISYQWSWYPTFEEAIISAAEEVAGNGAKP